MRHAEAFIAFLRNENTQNVLNLVRNAALSDVLDKSKTPKETLRAVDNLRAIFDLEYTFRAYAENIENDQKAPDSDDLNGDNSRLIV